MSTNFKSIKAERTTETRDIHNLETSGTGNIFETIVALSKRSNQVALSLKKELADKLEEFVIPTDSLEEVFENREQIEISKFYERLPKPHSIARRRAVAECASAGARQEPVCELLHDLSRLRCPRCARLSEPDRQRLALGQCGVRIVHFNRQRP